MHASQSKSVSHFYTKYFNTNLKEDALCIYLYSAGKERDDVRADGVGGEYGVRVNKVLLTFRTLEQCQPSVKHLSGGWKQTGLTFNKPMYFSFYSTRGRGFDIMWTLHSSLKFTCQHNTNEELIYLLLDASPLARGSEEGLRGCNFVRGEWMLNWRRKFRPRGKRLGRKWTVWVCWMLSAINKEIQGWGYGCKN